MSYCAGGDVFANVFYSIVVKALQVGHGLPAIYSNDNSTQFIKKISGYTAKVEEVDVRVLGSRMMLERHSTRDTTVSVARSIHRIICVALKDGTT
jgi:hypothetical protein